MVVGARRGADLEGEPAHAAQVDDQAAADAREAQQHGAQPGQRSTVPGRPRRRRPRRPRRRRRSRRRSRARSSPRREQLAEQARGRVAVERSRCRPSSASCRAEALGPDPRRRRGRAPRGRRPPPRRARSARTRRPAASGGRQHGLLEHRAVDAARVARPAGRRLARVGDHGPRRRSSRARRRRARPRAAARRAAGAASASLPALPAVAQHRHQRHEPGAAGDEQQRAALGGVPGEPAAERPAHLELVARPRLVDEVRRDLAVVEPLDGDRRAAVLGRRRDRVAALRLVAVLGGQADVDVLAGAVAGPARRRRARASPRAASRGATSRTVAARQRARLSRPGSAAHARGRRGRGSRASPRSPARPPR